MLMNNSKQFQCFYQYIVQKLWLAAVFFSLQASSFATAASELQDEDWFNNSVGFDSIILPGFSPLEFDAMTRSLRLGADRVYRWTGGLLPSELTVGGIIAAKNLDIVITKEGKALSVGPAELRVLSSTDTRVELETRASYGGEVEVIVTSVVEYDGVAMLTVELIPNGSVTVDSVKFKASIMSNAFTKMLAFKADTVRNRRKDLVFPTEYQGEFLNALAFPNGEHAFWWFADNAKGWIWNSPVITSIQSASDDEITLEQNIVADRWTLSEPMRIKFNFLLTPVKTLKPNWRSQRVATRVTKQEGRYGRYQLWWTTAFAHQNLPYLDYPLGTRKKIPAEDFAFYPGVKKNNQLLKKWRSFGIDRIPYFSAHALSGIDPALNEYRKQWEVDPPFVMPAKSDRPFKLKMKKPWLSHRAEGYSDYLIYHFDKVIDQLDVQGLYFDQGGVIQSKNSYHGLWIDSNGVERASTDILAMREFFKRLAVVFHNHGRSGEIVVHNSMVPIVPAYTFITSMVQGEEFVQYLKDLDYFKSTSFDQVRSKYAASQYGVKTIWLSELWSYKVKEGKPKAQEMSEWVESDRYQRAYRKLMATALLHDIPVLSFAPLGIREQLHKTLDNFGVDQANFVGYWVSGLTAQETGLDTSYYERSIDKRRLIILVNRATDERSINFSQLASALGIDREVMTYRVVGAKKFRPIAKIKITPVVPAEDFLMIELKQ